MTGIAKIRDLLDTKKISCAELTKTYMDAAKAENAELNAFISFTEETATTAAQTVDAKLAKGESISPLAGIPFVMKDNFSTDGIRTTAASKMLDNYIPIFSADVWDKMQAQGAVMLGKGNMDEFAMGQASYYGETKNPHNTTRAAEGSAAAVAAGLSAFGIGTDTAGSVRAPAAHCGIVGLRPTYGAASRLGILAYTSSFDQTGVFAASVRDTALVYDAIIGRDERDMTSRAAPTVSDKLTGDIKGKKIGIPGSFYKGVAADVEAPVREMAKTLEKLGATVVDVDFPLINEAVSALYVIAFSEASSNLGRFDGHRFGYHAEGTTGLDEYVCASRTIGFGDEVRRRIMLGTFMLSTGYFDEYFGRAKQVCLGIKNELLKLFGGVDMLLAPTAQTGAAPLGQKLTPVESYMTEICTIPASIAGVPALSVPCGFDKNGMPVGAQLIGGKFKEIDILNAALAFENETGRQFIKTPKGGVSL